MRISELSPDLRPTAAISDSHDLLDDLESSIREAESLSPDDLSSSAKLSGDLRRSLSRISTPLAESSKLHIWKLSYRLWNACVDLSNSTPSPRPDHADLRHIAADLLLVAGAPAGVPYPSLKSASFFLKTGQIWHDIGRFDLAAACFERATDLTSSVHIDEASAEEKQLLLDLNLSRSRTSWETSDWSLSVALLGRSKKLLFGSPAAYELLAEQYLQFGKLILSKGFLEGAPDASKLLSEALDLCETGIAGSRGRDEIQALEALKQRCLRFMMAERLQVEDYDGVLKCVRVLRGEGKGEDHPGVGYVAMKAWIGVGRIGEAERELKGMMAKEEVPDGVCVSAAETYLAVAGAEAARGVVMGLVGRCRDGAGAVLRVVQLVAEGGGGVACTKVVAELVSDERVAVLFEGAAAAKEREAMHAILWNYGAESFRSKDYQTSAEMIERSMLYLPRDDDSRPRRSHCFRVLSLCHLALSQLDRAQEFIDESEKLEPNIKSALLKFKIYLQKKDEKAAISHLQSIVSCIDFNPEYLTLSAHEAIACESTQTAIASLSTLLNLYSPGKEMPISEPSVIRNLITLLLREPGTEAEILKYTKRARVKIGDIGAESFFGKGDDASREQFWFAGNSWNMGLKTGREKKLECCAEFLELAADFYGVDGISNSAMVCRCLILSVGAKIRIEEEERVTIPDSDVKKAIEMLTSAGKLLPSVLSSTELQDQQIAGATFFMYTSLTYKLLGRVDNETTRSQQLQVIKSFAGSKVCNLPDLIQLALIAAQGDRPNTEAGEFAFSACLSMLLASPSPDYQMVALALRKLVGLAGLRDADGGKDEGAYGAYKQAYQIIVGLKDGEYPLEEGKWLAMTAWNRSGMAVRLRQVDVARRWMKLGVDLARRLQGMETYGRVMEECFSNFEKVASGGGVGAGVGGERVAAGLSASCSSSV